MGEREISLWSFGSINSILSAVFSKKLRELVFALKWLFSLVLFKFVPFDCLGHKLDMKQTSYYAAGKPWASFCLEMWVGRYWELYDLR